MLGDGSSIEANFRNGEINGRGLRRWPDGTTYSGEFRDGEFWGQGELIRPSGERYEGDFQANQRHGEGELVNPDGTVYQGLFSRHRKSGQGTEYYVDGSIFQGIWVSGEKEGAGRLEFPTGETLVGTWSAGSLVGSPVFTDVNAHFEYRGTWSEVGRPVESVSGPLQLQLPGLETLEPEIAATINFSESGSMIDASAGEACTGWKCAIRNKAGETPPETGRVIQVKATLAVIETDGACCAASIPQEPESERPITWREVQAFIPAGESVAAPESTASLSQSSTGSDPGLEHFLTIAADQINLPVDEQGSISLKGFKITDIAPNGIYRLLFQDATPFGAGSLSQGFAPFPDSEIVMRLADGGKNKKKKKKKK